MRGAPHVKPPSLVTLIHTAWSSVGRSFAFSFDLNTCPKSALVPSLRGMKPVGGMPAERCGAGGVTHQLFPLSRLIMMPSPPPVSGWQFALNTQKLTPEPSGRGTVWSVGQLRWNLYCAGRRSSMRVHVRPPSSDRAAGPHPPPCLIVQTQKSVLPSGVRSVVGCPWYVSGVPIAITVWRNASHVRSTIGSSSWYVWTIFFGGRPSGAVFASAAISAAERRRGS